MQLPKEYENLSYFGRGPWENYQDRNTSAFVDVYTNKVAGPLCALCQTTRKWL